MTESSTQPVVSVEVPVDRLDDLFKAVKDQHGEEEVELFVDQNPATKRMMQTVQEAYDAMSESLIRHIADVLK